MARALFVVQQLEVEVRMRVAEAYVSYLASCVHMREVLEVNNRGLCDTVLVFGKSE
jgi:hypothetical protein